MQFDTQWSWRPSIKLNVSVTMDVDTLGQRLKPMKHRNVTHRQCSLISVITEEAMLSNSLIETRVTVAPVSTNMLAFNPFTLAFIDIPASLANLLVKQARPLNLNDAVRHAVELEAFNKAERKRDDGRGYLRSTSQTNETQECDTQTITPIEPCL
jgi:hypothetical protein